MSKAFLFHGVKDMYLCLVLGVRSWRKKESFIVFVNFIFKSTYLEKNILRITLKGTHKWYECSLHLGVCLLRNISNMRCSVSSPDETPRRELKIRRAAEYFWRTSRCFIWWWNTVSNVWYFFSNKIIFEGEIKDANTKQCFIRFPNTH